MPGPPTQGVPRFWGGILELLSAYLFQWFLRTVTQPKGWEICVRLALTLLVARVLANDHDVSVTTDDLALVTDFLNAGLDLHDVLPCSLSSCERFSRKPLLSSNPYL